MIIDKLNLSLKTFLDSIHSYTPTIIIISSFREELNDCK
jgi:hypothetical protein